MQVWTAQYRYNGPARMDITVKTEGPLGKFFAPFQYMVNDYKYNDNHLTQEQKEEKYHKAYKKLIDGRIEELPLTWKDILELKQIVLVCYCKAGDFCHRKIVKDYLVAAGAEYMGELELDNSGSVTKIIDNFHGEHAFLSNFAPASFEYDNIRYPTVEHFYQAMKESSYEYRTTVAKAKTPGAAKKIGRKATLVWNWNTIKEDVMWYGLTKKFSIHQYAELLKSTGNAILVEGNNWHDNEWGNCSCKKCEHIEGKNLLGKMLMKIREGL